jgi:2-polyprenyl-3-methyl-5-hydroxy-6-metoxy-1,4-benzoquinol methylase
MSDYILPHSDPLKNDRLMVMSKMLDPHMRFRLSLLGPLEGWKCLEAGAGNGTMSQWLADQGRACPKSMSMARRSCFRAVPPRHDTGR